MIWKSLLLSFFIVGLVLFISACRKTPTKSAESLDVNNLSADLSVQDVSQLLNDGTIYLIDVREQDEWNAGHVAGAQLLPMSEIGNRLSEIPTDKPVIVMCRSGNRSSSVAQLLRDSGLSNIHNMTGGILAWQNAGLSTTK